ncbi:MAG: DUF4912 domain-containing protein [Pirellulales bacterium]
MTADHLRKLTAKDLALMARQAGITGWYGMRKEELIRALLLTARRHLASGHKEASGRKRTSDHKEIAKIAAKATEKGRSNSKQPPATKQTPNLPASHAAHSSQRQRSVTKSKAQQQLMRMNNKLAASKNLASSKTSTTDQSTGPVRLIVMVRDPYWLHANWDISEQSIQRAKAAMGGNWYRAQPILRLYQVADDSSSTYVRDIPIHGGVNHWYLDVQDPPLTYRLEIGYLATDRSFYCLAHSNTVTTPPAGVSDAIDKNWADVAEHADRIYAMSGGYSADGTSRELQELLEERLSHPLGSPMKTRYGNETVGQTRGMNFAVDAEIVVYGSVEKSVHLTLKGEPVELRSDGTFTVRVSMPNRRQILPIVASSADGSEQQTIILSVERNTKVMEPFHRDLTK